MSKAYPSNLTPNQFELLNDLIPAPKSGGRPREVDMWEILNAIFYILCEGCRWRLCQETFLLGRRCTLISATGVKMGLGWGYMIVYGSGCELGRQPSPSEAIIDSQSIKSAAMLSQDVGFDGENWFMDANDFWASIPWGWYYECLSLRCWRERGGKRVLKRVNQMGKAVSSAHDLGRWWVWRWAIHAVGDGRLPLDCSGGATKANQRICLA